MYKDNLADKFDKGLMTSLEINKISKELNNKVLEVKQEIYKTYNKEIETSMFVTKLCSFRNLFKNNRYGGYHHDRQLEYLIRYNNSFPEKKELWKKILNYRKINFKKTLLGELNGWRGVRKNRKKLWTQTGYTGVEYESLKYV
jgi:exoribonuclease II